MNDMCAFEADNCGKVLHDLYIGVILWGIAVDDIGKELHDGYEQKSDKKRYNLS